jgi:hypothetical protein
MMYQPLDPKKRQAPGATAGGAQPPAGAAAPMQAQPGAMAPAGPVRPPQASPKLNPQGASATFGAPAVMSMAPTSAAPAFAARAPGGAVARSGLMEQVKGRVKTRDMVAGALGMPAGKTGAQGSIQDMLFPGGAARMHPGGDGAPVTEAPPPGYRVPGLEGAIAGNLARPSRYDDKFVGDALGVINADLDRSRGDRTQELSELMSARGLLGSSLEVEGTDTINRGLAEEESRRKLDLARTIADASAQDRAGAVDDAMGYESARYGQGYGDRELDFRKEALHTDEELQRLAQMIQYLDVLNRPKE